MVSYRTFARRVDAPSETLNQVREFTSPCPYRGAIASMVAPMAIARGSREILEAMVGVCGDTAGRAKSCSIWANRRPIFTVRVIAGTRIDTTRSTHDAPGNSDRRLPQCRAHDQGTPCKRLSARSTFQLRATRPISGICCHGFVTGL